MSNDGINLKDGWTHDADYRRCYQTEDDIDSVIKLLDLEHATGLVDVGCGNGAFAIAAAHANSRCAVWAFDALESAVAQCKGDGKRLPNLDAGVSWAHSIPLGDSSVDRALFRSVLHHIPEPQNVYREISRILKMGGLLLLQAPCNNWEPSFADLLSELMWITDQSHKRFFYSPAQIVSGLEAAGFVIEKQECWPYSFPFLNERQAEFVRQHEAHEKLRLKQIELGKWSMDGCWVRILGRKKNTEKGFLKPEAEVEKEESGCVR